MNAPRKNLEQRARELYREASQHIDPATAGRLRAARRTALESANAPKHRTARWLIPSGAFAMLALAALMVWQPLPQRTAVPPANIAVSPLASTEQDSELPPDADQADPNLYQNLDFYGWLAANDQPAATNR
jgi:hypothetical protein